MGAYIAVDFGGTRIRVAVYPENGEKPLIQEKIPTRGEGTTVDRIVNQIKKLWPVDNHVLGIGVAAPGPVDPKAGVLLRAPNIPGCTNLPLKRILEDKFNVQVSFGNDANMAAVGEWRYGAGAGHHNLVYLTISTGIGGGVILDDRLVLGEHGLAAELGHLTVVPDGDMCGCGHRGHLEAYSSGTAIARYVNEQIAAGRETILKPTPPPTAKDVATAAAQGDPLSIEAFTRAGTYLGRAIADFLHTFNPTIIILGGGVASTGPLLMHPIRGVIESMVMSPQFLDNLTITTAALGDDAGLLGTLALARIQNLERQLIPDD